MSIFQRTLLLMTAALLIAVGIGTTLINTRPPLRNMPVPLSEIAEMLRSGAGVIAPETGYALPSQTPRRPPQEEWHISLRATPPAPLADEDADRSQSLRTALAAALERPPQDVLLSVPRSDGGDRGFERAGPGGRPDGPGWGPPPHDHDGGHGPGPPFGFGDDPMAAGGPMGPPPDGGAESAGGAQIRLGQGYLAALRDANGQWRVLESVPRSFIGPFGLQVLLLVALGVALLVPLAWWFARALAAPVQRFASAAQRLGADSHAPPLDGSGPAEMRAATEAFNTMQDRLNRLLAERTQLIGAIAHDLRTPLTRLAFRLESLPEPLAGKVEADIAEMNAMITAALDFLRDRSLRGARERLDFRLLVEGIVDDRSDLGHDVTLQRGAPVTLRGDPVALRRLVSNLVDNALKYGERARLALFAEAGQCRLVVDDDGPGIRAELRERVFEPFFRAEGSRNRDTGGIGLGLTTVRAIALDHGGEVRLENRAEGGLRVVVTLPQAA